MTRWAMGLGILAVIGTLTSIVACGGGGSNGTPSSNAAYIGTCRQSDKDQACTDFYVEENSMGLSQADIEDSVKQACNDSTHSYSKTKCDATQYVGGCQYPSDLYHYVVFSSSMSETVCATTSGTKWIPRDGETADGDSDTVVEDGDADSKGPNGTLVGSCLYNPTVCIEFYSGSYDSSIAAQVCAAFPSTFSATGCDRTKCLGACMTPDGSQAYWYLDVENGLTAEEAKAGCTSGTWLNP